MRLKASHVAKDKDYPMPKRTANPTYLANRRALLADKPDCHWCGTPNATEADHILEHDAGGTDDLDNLVPPCLFLMSNLAYRDWETDRKSVV